MTISEHSIPNANMSIELTSYFTKNFNLAKKEIDLFFSIFSKDVRELQGQASQIYGIDSLRPLDMLPFAKWPLVAFEDRVYAVSLPLLMRNSFQQASTICILTLGLKRINGKST